MSGETEETVENRPPWQFEPGQSGNPNGRPKGARSRLSEAFLKAVQEDFAKHGIKALEDMRADKPGDYIKVVASIIPKAIIGSDDDEDAAIRVSLIKRIIVDP